MSFLIIANWKMNGTRSSFVDFIDKLKKKSDKISSKLIICPPFTSFPDRIELNSNISIGAQNCYHRKSGSYTGEVSAEMLKELGCAYVILGHSERSYETDNKIKLKAEIALDAGLHPIICVGEKLEDYKSGKTKEVIEYQCASRLPACGEYTIAYEPIWAIGTSRIPNNDSILKIIEVINSERDVIYGGSVNSQNVENLLNIPTLSGVLVGSASLDFDHFYAIVQKIEERF